MYSKSYRARQLIQGLLFLKKHSKEKDGIHFYQFIHPHGLWIFKSELEIDNKIKQIYRSRIK